MLQLKFGRGLTTNYHMVGMLWPDTQLILAGEIPKLLNQNSVSQVTKLRFQIQKQRSESKPFLIKVLLLFQLPYKKCVHDMWEQIIDMTDILFPANFQNHLKNLDFGWFSRIL